MTGKKFEYPGLRVRFQDVDRAGIAFFAMYYEYCHIAFEEFVEQVLGLSPDDFFAVKHFGAPLVATGSSHHAPLRHGDRLTVHVWVKALGRTSMTIGYQIDTDTKVRCASIWTKHVFVHAEAMKSIEIPPDIRAALTDYLCPEPEEKPS